MNVKNEKKVLVLSIIGIIKLIIAVVGATYAYFQAQGGVSAKSDIDVITGTTDLLSFSFGDIINIQANQENFAQGKDNLSDSTTGTAILKANNTTNSVTTRYNIYLVIEENDFVYTTEEGTPEIFLNVTDPNGKKIENITGLVHYEDGFDITTRTGGFLLIPDYVISAGEKQTVQDWNIEVTFVNLDSDQNANTNKTLTGRLYMTQDQMSSYELTQINNIKTTVTYNSIDATLDITNGSANVSKYYYGIDEATTTRNTETVEYIESDSSNYKFTNLEPNKEYNIYSYVIDENKIKSNIYETSTVTDNYNYPIINAVSYEVTLNSISLTVDASKGSNEISKYMYSKDNGLSWEESTSNTYIFTDLTDSTKYDVKVKLVDSDNIESTEYYEAITTEIYILPVVQSVEVITTWNSITLTPSGANGTYPIDHYEYSINDGEYQTSNVFSNLTDNTIYTIKVKAIDSVGRVSNIYDMNVTTDMYKLPVINNVTTYNAADSITINVDATSGDGSIVSYHYSRDDGSNYQVSNDSSYIFNNLSINTTYYIKVFVTDSNGRVSGEYSLTANTVSSDVILTMDSKDDTFNPNSVTTLSCANATANYNQKYHRIEISQINDEYTNCIINYQPLSTKDYLNQKVISMAGTTQGSGQVINENGYRYEGSNPDNYVWFNNELWRIIGVFDESTHGQSGQNLVKIIRTLPINSGSLSSNNWSSSSGNRLLNNYYYNSLDATDTSSCILGYLTGGFCDYRTIGIDDIYRLMIKNVTWYLGQRADSDATADMFYADERGTTVYSGATSTTGYIGLMYPSDYGYGVLASSCARSTNLNVYNTVECAGQNWLYGQGSEWTITGYSTQSYSAFFLYYNGALTNDKGYLGTLYNFTSSVYNLRPVLYLDEDVYVISGTGSITDPYTIGM